MMPRTKPRPGAAKAAAPAISPEALKQLREKAKVDRAEYAHKPGVDEILEEQPDATPAAFTRELRAALVAIKRAREAAGLSLGDVSERTGITPQTLSRIENGKVTNPTWRTLGRLAVAVGCKLKLEVSPAGR